MVSFRPITLEDRPAVVEICSLTWNGDDYIASVFDQWLAAPGSYFTAAEVDGRLAGLGRLASFAPGEYWLEGLRVHPEYRGRGIASALHAYLLERWRQAGPGGTLRLATDTDNQASLHLCRRTGFQPLLDFAFVEAPALDAPHRFQRVTPEDAGRAFRIASRVPLYAEQHGLCDLGWKWRSLTPEFMSERAAEGAVYRWGDWEGVLFIAHHMETETDPEFALAQFPGVDTERRPAFLADGRALAGALGRARLRWCPPARPDLLGELAKMGFARPWEGALTCLELRG